jgi:hypothetical protein
MKKAKLPRIPFSEKFGQPLAGDLPGRIACSKLLNVFYGLRFAGTAYLR